MEGAPNNYQKIREDDKGYLKKVHSPKEKAKRFFTKAGITAGVAVASFTAGKFSNQQKMNDLEKNNISLTKDNQENKEEMLNLVEEHNKLQAEKDSIENVNTELTRENTELKNKESKDNQENKEEMLNLDIEKKLEEFTLFYKQNNIDLPANFEDNIKEIWNRNTDEIKESIENNGFDDIILMPENMPLPDLHSKMTEGYADTWQGSNFTEGGSFAGAKSPNVDKMRIVLVHKIQNLKDNPKLEKTLNIKGQDVKLDEVLSLEDYLVFQRKFFNENGKHLDEVGATWLSTKSGSRLVYSHWGPSGRRLNVCASGLDSQHDAVGARPSRSFF